MHHCKSITARGRRLPELLLLLLMMAAGAASQEDAPTTVLSIDCGNGWQRDICLAASAGFSFHDGCNRVTCDSDGQFSTTFMACPPADSEALRARCRNIREDVRTQLESATQLTCPMLNVLAVCATASKGFTYSDGCNVVVCDGAGRGSTTFMACPEPVRPAEVELCERRANRVIGRLESRSCSLWLNNTALCLARGAGQRFSDGCNTVECQADGEWTTTLMQCPIASNNSAFCQWVRQQATGGSSSTSSGSSGAGEDRSVDIYCPALSMSQVCTAERVGFRYVDGCNSVNCMSPGRGSTTMRLCRAANATEAARVCSDAQAAMERKLAQSKRRTQCLTAADVCQTPGERKSFFDGCNYCFCMGLSRAGCTRRACRSYFSTEEEFRQECERRRAGIIN